MKNFENIKLKNKLLDKISKSFLINDIKYIFGYGSGVIPQKNHVASMIDVFFIVENLKKFHLNNIKKNDEHYSSLAKSCGVDTLVKFNKYGTGVYYNPSINIGNDVLIKYGVISLDDFNYHNKNWDSLFVPGRFQKPVLSILSDNEIEKSLDSNREAAFILTILRNNERIKKVDFFEDLAKISYVGDIRTYVKAEKKDKVKNAILGSFGYYLEVYEEIIKKYNISTDDEYFQFNPKLNFELIEKLPKYFIRRLMDHLNIFDEKEFKNHFCFNFNSELRRIILDSYLSNLNFKNSTQGIITSLYSTDMTKSFSYMLEKYKKALK